MAALAEPAGAREQLVYPDSPVRQSPLKGSPGPSRSPRCEAFVMTGDKILNLDHHVSPSYAKAVQDQLPPLTHIQETPVRPPLVEFPSVRRSMRSRLPISVSHPDSMTKRQYCPDKENEEEPSASGSSGSGTPSAALPPPIDEEFSKEEISSPEVVRTPADSTMNTSYYKSAFSNPQHSTRRTSSANTFIISPSDSPMKNSTVTVHATTCGPSVSAAATNRTIEDFGSFRSDTSDAFSRDDKEAARMARRLFQLEGCSKTDVTTRLNDVGEFASLVTIKYLELFNFSGIRIDAALRDFLARVELRGESSQRERLLRFFSARYHESNPSLFNNVDEVHTLTCALLLLNSDLHGPNIGKKMSVREFINNIGHTGVQIKRDLLKTLYSSIKDTAISHHKDMQTKAAAIRSLSSRQVLCDIDPESQVEYKSGWLVRKCIYDSDGAKTPLGRRGWKMWYARLRGLVLYLSRDEDIKGNKFETFSNSILLHHAFAEAVAEYKKRQHIFRVRTANLGEFLFQTSGTTEVNEWVSMLNFAAAAFSSRSLPPPTGSQITFSIPRLPKLPSQGPLSQQLRSHESAAGELRRQLSRVQEDAPPLKAKGRCVEEFFFRERYLTQEIKRYEEYANLLRRRLGTDGSESTSGVHSKSDIVDDDKISYKEAMHH